VRRRTSRARARFLASGLLLGASCLASGCSRFRNRPPPPLKAPIEAFKDPVWKNFKGEAFHAPESSLRPWRAMAFQEVPRPKKNPRWRTIAVHEAVELEMPKGSRFRCLVNPAEVHVQEGEMPTKPAGWRVIRAVRCSSDGWRTSSQAAMSVSYGLDGAQGERSERQAELYLLDTVDGKPTRIAMLLQPL